MPFGDDCTDVSPAPAAPRDRVLRAPAELGADEAEVLALVGSRRGVLMIARKRGNSVKFTGEERSSCR